MNPDDPNSDASWLPPELAKKAEWLPVSGDRPEGMYVSVGGNIGRTTASLRLSGEDLEPEAVSTQLGCAPTASYRKGDPADSRGKRLRNFGSWRLESSLDGRHCLDDHIEDLLARVTGNLSTWKELGRFKPDVFVGYFLSGFNQGDGISARTLRMLAERGIRLELDIYSAPRD